LPSRLKNKERKTSAKYMALPASLPSGLKNESLIKNIHHITRVETLRQEGMKLVK